MTTGCPLCGGDGTSAHDPHDPSLRRCPTCDVVFAPDRTLSDTAYAEAYRDDRSGTNLSALSSSLVWPRQSVAMREAEEMLKDAPRALLERLKQIVPPPADVYDIGCGQGWFLGALRAAGYRPAGLDPSPDAIEVIAAHGLPAAVGMIESIPADWPAPAAVSLFEVIEHLTDPLASVRALHERFPDAVLIGSVPSEARWTMLFGREEWDYPPNHMTRWTPRSLAAILRTAGYADAEVVRVPATRFEMSQVSVRWMLARLRGRFEPERWSVPAYPSAIRPLHGELAARRRKEPFLLPLEIVARLARCTSLSWGFIARTGRSGGSA